MEAELFHQRPQADARFGIGGASSALRLRRGRRR
jgi:hypothetical protein